MSWQSQICVKIRFIVETGKMRAHVLIINVNIPKGIKIELEELHEVPKQGGLKAGREAGSSTDCQLSYLSFLSISLCHF